MPKKLILDDTDRHLLAELQADADRPNVALARLVGLSPAATLNRVRRLKESGVIRRIAARLDAPDAEKRAALFGSQLIGLMLYRHVLHVEPVASMPAEELVRRAAPALQRHLTGS